jgi:adenosylhomocysteine nucleosidase
MKSRANGLLLLVVLAALLLSPLAAASAASGPPAPAGAPAPSQGFDQAPRIAIISAYAPELDALKAQTNVDKVVVLNGRSVYVGSLAGHKVLLTLSGISMVNAAMTTQALVDRFRVERIIFSGIAGGVNPGLNIGDVVIPVRWSEYQENLFARETQPGVFTPPDTFEVTLPNYGMMYPQDVDICTVNGEPDDEIPMVWFPVDGAMLAVAARTATSVELDRCAGDVCLDASPVVRPGGSGVSGPTFVDNAAYRDYAWNTWQADALDMESAAVAHVATANGVPFIIFRSLSDLAGGGPGENEIDVFFQLAADNSAKVMLAFLQAWPKR